MIACLCWIILLVIVIVFMCSLMPWWIVSLIFGGAFIYNFFLCDDSIFKIQIPPFRSRKNLKRVKKKIEQQEKTKNQKKTNKPVRKQDGRNITSKAKTKKSSVVGDTAAVLAGAALAHQAIKHHHHDNTRDLTSEHDDFYDADLDDWYDLDAEEAIDYDDDVQYYDNTSYEDIGYYDDVEANDDYQDSMD